MGFDFGKGKKKDDSVPVEPRKKKVFKVEQGAKVKETPPIPEVEPQKVNMVGAKRSSPIVFEDKVLMSESLSLTIPDDEERLIFLHDELFKCSLDVRRRLILGKWKASLKDFREKLGEHDFNKKLREFMMEDIEGKILASQNSD